MFGDTLSIGEALSVVFTGIVVVFLALAILIVFLYAMGAIFESMSKKKTTTPSTPVNDAPAAPAAPSKQITQAAVSSNGLSNEVVAAITAAISCVWSEEGNTVPFVIKSIKKTRGGPSRKAWNMAGVLENTRPF